MHRCMLCYGYVNTLFTLLNKPVNKLNDSLITCEIM